MPARDITNSWLPHIYVTPCCYPNLQYPLCLLLACGCAWLEHTCEWSLALPAASCDCEPNDATQPLPGGGLACAPCLKAAFSACSPAAQTWQVSLMAMYSLFDHFAAQKQMPCHFQHVSHCSVLGRAAVQSCRGLQRAGAASDC